MRKILVTLLLTIFSLTIFNSNLALAEGNSKALISKNLILTQYKLEKYKKGKDYIKAIDSFIEKNSREKLEKIREKVDKFLEIKKLREGQTLLVIKYLKYKLDLTLLEEVKTVKEQVKEVQKLKEKKQIENINETEKQKVEREILSLQKNVLSGGESFLNIINEKFEKELNVEQSGDMSLKLDFDYDDIGNINYDFSLKDYIAKSNSSFESSFEGDLKSNLDYNLEKVGAGILKFSSKYKQILKDGDYYISLDNFHISEKENMKDLEKFLNILEKIGEEDKYIKLPSDKQTKEAYMLLKTIKPEFLKKQFKDLENKALFEVYGKSSGKYLLKPTKFACDKFKEFDNFSIYKTSKTCSEEEYKDMLDAIKEIGDLYIAFEGNNTKFGWTFEDNSGKFDLYVVYNRENIEEINLSAKPKDEKFKGEYISFKYLNKKSLNIDIIVDKLNFKFHSDLDNNNNFTNIDSNYKYKNSTANLSLKNHKITGKLNLIEEGYDYNDKDWKKVEKTKIIGNISGETKTDNSLENLDINYKGIDLLNNNKEFLNGKANFKEKYFNISFNIMSEWIKVEFLVSADLGEKYFPQDGEFKFIIHKKDAKFDFDTYKTTYSGDFKKVFSSKINIKNKEISGETSFPDYLTISHDGWINYERFNFDNSIKAEKKLIEDINLKKKDSKKINSLYGVFNLSGEYTNNKSNYKITSYFDVSGKEVFRLEFKNDYNINYKDRGDMFIENPGEYIDFEKLDLKK